MVVKEPVRSAVAEATADPPKDTATDSPGANSDPLTPTEEPGIPDDGLSVIEGGGKMVNVAEPELLDASVAVTV